MGAPLDLTGKPFGRLTARLLLEERSPRGERRWLCDCACGATDVRVTTGHLTTGHTRSCGCLRRERSKQIGRTTGKSNIIEVNRRKSQRFRAAVARGIKIAREHPEWTIRRIAKASRCSVYLSRNADWRRTIEAARTSLRKKPPVVKPRQGVEANGERWPLIAEAVEEYPDATVKALHAHVARENIETRTVLLPKRVRIRGRGCLVTRLYPHLTLNPDDLQKRYGAIDGLITLSEAADRSKRRISTWKTWRKKRCPALGKRIPVFPGYGTYRQRRRGKIIKLRRAAMTHVRVSDYNAIAKIEGFEQWPESPPPNGQTPASSLASGQAAASSRAVGQPTEATPPLPARRVSGRPKGSIDLRAAERNEKMRRDFRAGKFETIAALGRAYHLSRNRASAIISARN